MSESVKMEKEKCKLKISIITATYNAATHLPCLIASLREQTDKDFEWVVADGASTDKTLEILHGISDLNLVIDSRKDFGIYDALNRAIQVSTGDYYIVSGSDDVFHATAIASFRKEIVNSKCEIIAANALYNGRMISNKRWPSWIFGQSSYISAHTLATAFNKSLHEKYGYFSSHYPIAADQLFVMTVCLDGTRCYKSGCVAGKIGCTGVSSRDRVGNATELFRVQISLGRSYFLQLVLLLMRLLRIRWIR